MDAKELKKILGKHGKWMRGDEGGSRANLSGADLSGADLSRADLSRANLSGADLSGADLSRAYLSRAYLSGANLSGANLSGAYLSRAYLSGANLSGADLSRADLSRANLSGANLSGADLSRANLSRAYLSGANLSETILSNINWLTYIGIQTLPDGTAYGYKLINAIGNGIYRGGIDYLKATKFEVKNVDGNVNEYCSYGINLATFEWCLTEKKDKDNRILLMKFDVKDAVCPIGSDGKFRVKACEKVGEVDWNGNLIKES